MGFVNNLPVKRPRMTFKNSMEERAAMEGDAYKLECIGLARELLYDVALALGLMEPDVCHLKNNPSEMLRGETQEMGGLFDEKGHFTFVFALIVGRSYMEFSWILFREAERWYILHGRNRAVLAIDRSSKTTSTAELVDSLEADVLELIVDSSRTTFLA
jgi:hypothetical protein